MYHVWQFPLKANIFDFFNPNLPKKYFWGQSFEILIPDSESATQIYHVCQLLGKKDKFELFRLNLGKLRNYVLYFGSYNIEGVAEG